MAGQLAKGTKTCFPARQTGDIMRKGRFIVITAAAAAAQAVALTIQMADLALTGMPLRVMIQQYTLASLTMVLVFDLVFLLPGFVGLAARKWLTVWTALAVGIAGGAAAWALVWWGMEPVMTLFGDLFGLHRKPLVLLLRLYEINGVAGALAAWGVWRMMRRAA